MISAAESKPRLFTPQKIAIGVILIAYIAWLLSLPAFPTQDGPIHLYYTHVLRALFSNSDSVYARFYTVKHLLPPYSLYYYGLLAISHFTSLLVADRLIIGAYVVSFVLGFRYLARAIGPGADSMTLLATVLLLNWPLGMGFVNFCLSLSFAFWALGLWLRFAGRAAPGARIGFVLLAILTMFTHPLPLLLLVGVAGLELVLRAVARRRDGSARAFITRDIVTLGCASLTLEYVRLFATSRPLQQTSVSAQGSSLLHRLAQNVVNYAAEKGVAFLLGGGLELRLYRILLLAVLVIPSALALRQFIRNRREQRWTRGDVTLLLGIATALLLPFVPPDLNGSHFFAERLLLLVWLFPLAAASGSPTGMRGTAALIILAVAGQALVLHLADRSVRPVANAMAAIQNAPAAIASQPGELGLALNDPRTADPPPGLSFNPYLWGAVNVFRHDNSVLANTPWLDLAIIPLGGTQALPASQLPPEALEFPSILRERLASDPDTQDRLLHSVDFALIEQAYLPGAAGMDPLLANHSTQWTCRTAAQSWLRACTRQSQTAAP